MAVQTVSQSTFEIIWNPKIYVIKYTVREFHNKGPKLNILSCQWHHKYYTRAIISSSFITKFIMQQFWQLKVSLMDPWKWLHVKSPEDFADLLSRGVDLKSIKILPCGGMFLPNYFSLNSLQKNNISRDIEIPKCLPNKALFFAKSIDQFLPHLIHYVPNSLHIVNYLKVIAYCLRFYANFSSKNQKKLQNSTRCLICLAQGQAFDTNLEALFSRESINRKKTSHCPTQPSSNLKTNCSRRTLET